MVPHSKRALTSPHSGQDSVLHKQQNEQHSQGARKGRNARTYEGYKRKKINVSGCVLKTYEGRTVLWMPHVQKQTRQRIERAPTYSVKGSGRISRTALIINMALPHGDTHI